MFTWGTHRDFCLFLSPPPPPVPTTSSAHLYKGFLLVHSVQTASQTSTASLVTVHFRSIRSKGISFGGIRSNGIRSKRFAQKAFASMVFASTACDRRGWGPGLSLTCLGEDCSSSFFPLFSDRIYGVWYSSYTNTIKENRNTISLYFLQLFNYRKCLSVPVLGQCTGELFRRLHQKWRS